MDYFDADIEERLRSLEEEEARLEATGAYAPEEEDEGRYGMSSFISGFSMCFYIYFVNVFDLYVFL